MSVVKGLTPVDLSSLLTGPCRVLWADPNVTSIPTNLLDMFAVEKADGYEPASGWSDFGAKVEGVAYGRSIETSGYELEDVNGAVGETVTDTVRTVSLSRGELTADTLRDFEQATAAVEDVAVEGGEKRRPERHAKFGSIETLGRKRIAIVARRVTGVGADVIEQDGTRRGALVCGLLHTCGLQGDSAQIQISKGQLATAPLTLKAFPEGGLLQGEETGIWIEEVPGEIGGS